MLNLIKLLIGLVMLVSGLAGLATFVFPELPVRLAFQSGFVREWFGPLIQKWFGFADFLQQANTTDYLGSLLLCFGLAVAGAFTCLKAGSEKKRRSS